jgi:ATP-dependent Clp protease ATP-binding subunit ClpX
MATRSALYCSVCGQAEHQVRKLINAGKFYICDACITECQSVLDDELGAGSKPSAGANASAPAAGKDAAAFAAAAGVTAPTANANTSNAVKKLPTPIEIKQTLDEYVIGQEQAVCSM